MCVRACVHVAINYIHTILNMYNKLRGLVYLLKCNKVLLIGVALITESFVTESNS